jgi:phospholipid transport system transporter-binding protein
MLRGPGPIELDLSLVREANSAGLALLLEWLDLARGKKLELQLYNLPAPLARLAALANLDGLLPIAEDQGSGIGTGHGPSTAEHGRYDD